MVRPYLLWILVMFPAEAAVRARLFYSNIRQKERKLIFRQIWLEQKCLKTYWKQTFWSFDWILQPPPIGKSEVEICFEGELLGLIVPQTTDFLKMFTICLGILIQTIIFPFSEFRSHPFDWKKCRNENKKSSRK